MLAPDHDTVTCASDVLERARQHHAIAGRKLSTAEILHLVRSARPEPEAKPPRIIAAIAEALSLPPFSGEVAR
jgi:hypothetical protein